MGVGLTESKSLFWRDSRVTIARGWQGKSEGHWLS